MSKEATQPVLMAIFAVATAIVRYQQAFGDLEKAKTVSVTEL